MTAHSKNGGKKDQVRVVGRWQSIPVAMLRDKELKPQARMLCSLLYTFQGNDPHCYPMQRSLAELMCTTERTIQSLLVTLVRHRYVSITRTIYGNLYTLHEPNRILTNPITGSDADPITGSPHPITGSDADPITGSDASITKSHPCLESPTPPPPTPEGGDDDSDDSIRSEESDIAQYLRDELQIVVWKELATKHKDVPLQLIKDRVEGLIDKGKGQGIIVKSLREVAFTPGKMSEHGPLPADADYWHNYGFTVGDEDADTLQQMLEMSDPELREYFRQCGLARPESTQLNQAQDNAE